MATSMKERHDRKRTAVHYQGDGLVDIYIWLMIWGLGISILANMAWMSGVLVAVFLPIWLTAKQSLMTSRLTDAELAQAESHGADVAKARLFVLAMLGLMVGLVALFLFASGIVAESWRLWLGENSSLLAGMFGGVALAVIGVVIKAPRFYGYAVLSVAIIGIGSLLGVEFPLTVVALGAVIFGVGVVFLIRFLRTHPQIEREQTW